MASLSDEPLEPMETSSYLNARSKPGGFYDRGMEEPLMPDTPPPPRPGEVAAPLTLEEQHKQALSGSTWNLAKAILGVGLLALPKVTAHLGIGTTLIFTAFIAFLTYLSLHALTVASTRSGHLRYSDVVKEHTGIFGQALLDLSLIVNSFGILTITLIIVGDVLVGDGAQGLLSPECGGKRTVLAAVVVILIAPLVSITRMRSISGTSLLGVVAIIGWAVLTLLLFLTALTNGQVHTMHWWPSGRFVGHGFESAVQVIATLPVILVAFICQMSLQHVLRDLTYVRDTQVDRMSGTVLATTFVAYSLIGIFSYGLFGRNVDADVLREFTVDALGAMVPEPLAQALFLTIRVAFLLSLLPLFALQMSPLRDALWKLLFRTELRGPGLYLVTYLLLAAIYFAAISVKSIWEPLVLIGSTAGVLIALVFPGLMAMRTPELMTEQESARTYRMIIGAFLIVIGLVMGVFGVLRVILYKDPLDG